MPGNRKKAERQWFEIMEMILPGSENKKIYEDMFEQMSDTQFDKFIKDLKSGEQRLALVVPNLSNPKLSVERNLDVAEKLGHEFRERIWIDPGNETPPYLSPLKYLVVDLPLRRQAQHLAKKKSIPTDTRSVDDLTGQPTGKSKGAKVSFPETQILTALGLKRNLEELLKFRGGDVKGFDAMNTQISRTGGVSLDSLGGENTRVRATETLSYILTSMHLRNTLLEAAE